MQNAFRNSGGVGVYLITFPTYTVQSGRLFEVGRLIE